MREENHQLTDWDSLEKAEIELIVAESKRRAIIRRLTELLGHEFTFSSDAPPSWEVRELHDLLHKTSQSVFMRYDDFETKKSIAKCQRF